VNVEINSISLYCANHSHHLSLVIFSCKLSMLSLTSLTLFLSTPMHSHNSLFTQAILPHTKDNYIIDIRRSFFDRFPSVQSRVVTTTDLLLDVFLLCINQNW
jgi:hypothetical protein